MQNPASNIGLSRRDVVKSSAAVLGSALLVNSGLSSAVYAAGSQKLKIGLVGCGGRGSGAAKNALGADPNAELVAVGDMFDDQLARSVEALEQDGDVGAQVNIPKDKRFVGPDAYKGVIDAVDVVLLATPPQFRPMHLKAAIEANKHVFCEKPVGVDAPGVKSVMETVKLAAEKKLNLVSGLCFRYDDAKREVMKRVHDGQIGDLFMLQTNYLTGGLWTRPRKPDWSDTEWQVRNWLYFYWLSGDHIVEQHIHSLDKMLWAMKDEAPMKVLATGGRVQRTQPEYGNVFDHFTSTFEWKNGTRCIAQCRQFVNCDTDVSDWLFGSKGVADVMNHKITGANEWKRKPASVNMYDAEHVALFNAIHKGEVINNGDYMCKSTMMAIMARMSAYSGRAVTWDEAMASDVKLGPAKLDMKAQLAVDPVAVPGGAKQA